MLFFNFILKMEITHIWDWQILCASLSLSQKKSKTKNYKRMKRRSTLALKATYSKEGSLFFKNGCTSCHFATNSNHVQSRGHMAQHRGGRNRSV